MRERPSGRSPANALAQALVWLALGMGASWAQDAPVQPIDRSKLLQKRVPAQAPTEAMTQVPAQGATRARVPTPTPTPKSTPGTSDAAPPAAQAPPQRPSDRDRFRALAEAAAAAAAAAAAGHARTPDPASPPRQPAPDRPAPRTPDPPVQVPRYRVPDLAGQDCIGARQAVMNAGLMQFQCEVVAGPGTLPSGRIYSQSPGPGTILNEQRPVQARQQPVQVLVPNVVGMPEAQAAAAVAQRNLRASMSGPAASIGRQVANQSPQAGAAALPGSSVSLTLALTVPMLDGLDCDAARASARAHGFDAFGCEPRFAGASQPLHKVFEQLPRAGAVLASPQPVQVAVAKAVQVPNVVGLGLGKALAALDGAMLQGRPDGSDGDRDVRTQRPAAGSEAPPHSAVELATLRFVKVPAVVGLWLSDAKVRLQGAGLTDKPDHADRPDARKIDHQQPPAGGRAAADTAVALSTHVEVVVPDVLLKRLPAAMATLRQAGLLPKPDPEDRDKDRDPEREVRSQTPAAGTFVRENSEVALATMRLVVVPAVVGQTCESAVQKARDEGIAFRCKVDSLLPVTLGQPVVTSQPSFDKPVDQGTLIEVLAEPPWWSTPALLTMLVSSIGGLGWGGRRWFRWRPTPVPPPPPAPTLYWRLAPDIAPALSLHLGGVDGDARDRESRMGWRVAGGEPLVCLRGLQPLAGESK
ncbi:PASTA domain-containing protein [Variovorax ginsengisoli]|uniref:PASTA domain-containing protein n=1 Tax=Variovorax ginsengisoli TaxID=363844 RepID=A0ABT8SDM0_9BURK|nr:PASTA domain-containing protein [Variovorax ginsengisoli]MDN8617338.1 PASTA domain-containing protein [Variovorax ginsengisoli]MDO1536508.1 PASTA domain-containing protein [Variovorax ginsengisoli]